MAEISPNCERCPKARLACVVANTSWTVCRNSHLRAVTSNRVKLSNSIFAAEFPDPSYPKLWSYPTRIKALLRKQATGEAVVCIDEGLAIADKMGDAALKMRLRLLKAEAAVQQKNDDVAAHELQLAAVEQEQPTLELVAEHNRVSSLLMAQIGEIETASSTIWPDLIESLARLDSQSKPKKVVRLRRAILIAGGRTQVMFKS